jgi:hypothetical protein
MKLCVDIFLLKVTSTTYFLTFTVTNNNMVETQTWGSGITSTL